MVLGTSEDVEILAGRAREKGVFCVLVERGGGVRKTGKRPEKQRGLGAKKPPKIKSKILFEIWIFCGIMVVLLLIFGRKENARPN